MTGEQIGTIDLVKQLNSAAVYRLIDQQGPISRIQIADVSNLSPASVTKIIRQLLERGLIKEVAQEASTGGRRAISLTTECTQFHSIAVHFGRSRITISLFDLSSLLLAKYDGVFQYHNQNSLVEGLFHCLRSFLTAQHHIVKELIAVAIVFLGLVDAESGIVKYMSHIPINNSPLST